MKHLRVPFMQEIKFAKPVIEIVACLDGVEKHSLDYTPWAAYPYKPGVQFSIAHSQDCILLKYFVDERSIRGAAGKINGNVWEDACVELFIAFDDEGYYNLEFNCIGTGLMGFGKQKPDRKRLPDDVIGKIKYHVSIQNEKPASIHWELTLAIPFEVFAHHNISALKGTACRANFYKCGDALPEPHFVAWSNIEAPQPNFHLPRFFGELVFE